MEWQADSGPFIHGPGLCADWPGLFTEEYIAEISSSVRVGSSSRDLYDKELNLCQKNKIKQNRVKQSEANSLA